MHEDNDHSPFWPYRTSVDVDMVCSRISIGDVVFADCSIAYFGDLEICVPGLVSLYDGYDVDVQKRKRETTLSCPTVICQDVHTSAVIRLAGVTLAVLETWVDAALRAFASAIQSRLYSDDLAPRINKPICRRQRCSHSGAILRPLVVLFVDSPIDRDVGSL